jgi:hypothetical protein
MKKKFRYLLIPTVVMSVTLGLYRLAAWLFL